MSSSSAVFRLRTEELVVQGQQQFSSVPCWRGPRLQVSSALMRCCLFKENHTGWDIPLPSVILCVLLSFPNKHKTSDSSSAAMTSALGSNLSELDRLLLELNAVQQSSPSFPTTGRNNSLILFLSFLLNNVIFKKCYYSQRRRLHPYLPAASPTMRTAAPLTSTSAPQLRRNQRKMEQDQKKLDLQWKVCWMSWRVQCLHPGRFLILNCCFSSDYQIFPNIRKTDCSRWIKGSQRAVWCYWITLLIKCYCFCNCKKIAFIMSDHFNWKFVYK